MSDKPQELDYLSELYITLQEARESLELEKRDFEEENNLQNSSFELSTLSSKLGYLQEILQPFQRSRNFVDTIATWKTIVDNVFLYQQELQLAQEHGLVTELEISKFKREFQHNVDRVLTELPNNLELINQDDVHLEYLLNQYLVPVTEHSISFNQLKLFAHALHDLDWIVSFIVVSWNCSTKEEFKYAFKVTAHQLDLDKWQRFAVDWNWDFYGVMVELGTQQQVNNQQDLTQQKSSFLSKIIKLVLNFFKTSSHKYLSTYLKQYDNSIAKLFASFDYQPLVVTVTGTNGKGTTCNLLSHLARHVPHLLFTSPHITNYQERFKIIQTSLEQIKHMEQITTCERYASSKELCCAQLHLELVAHVLNQLLKESESYTDKLQLQVHIPRVYADSLVAQHQHYKFVHLGYFGQAVMCLHYLLYRKQVPLLIQEVGIGGKLDPTNLLDADIAILTNVTFDHQNLLGNTLESILDNKVRVARANKSFYYADPQLQLLPELKAYQKEIGFVLHHHEVECKLNNQMALEVTAYNAWYELEQLLKKKEYQSYMNSSQALQEVLPLFGRRTCCHWLIVSAILQIESQIQKVHRQFLHDENIDWQEIALRNSFVFDVAHNIASMQELADFLRQKFIPTYINPCFEIVVGMGAEKDLYGSLQVFQDLRDCHIHIADFQRGTRGVSFIQTQANLQYLQEHLQLKVNYFSRDSLLNLLLTRSEAHRIWVFCGSFYFIANLLERWNLYPQLLVELQDDF